MEGAFSADLAHLYRVKLGSRRDQAPAQLALWLLNSELMCVACYRFGRFAERMKITHGAPGSLLVVVHRVWNRWITHVDHADISRQAQIGPGLLLMHRHGIVIGPSRIGSNCVIHHNVTIGQRVSGGDHGVPHIGDNVWIGPGAIITGGITIGDDVTISAGSVLSRDIPSGALVGGNPARVISQHYDNSAIMRFRASESRAGQDHLHPGRPSGPSAAE